MREGNLTLLYDFGTGLREAQPQHDLAHKLQALTSASKAVRPRESRRGAPPGREGRGGAGLPLKPPARGTSQIQVFLLTDSHGHKRVLVRVERSTVFSVDQDSALERADAYYLGGVPPDQLPPR